MPRVVVLTGAGISAESGLKTFRGAEGLWEGHRVEDVACPEAWARDPGRVLRFHNERRRALRSWPRPRRSACQRSWRGCWRGTRWLRIRTAIERPRQTNLARLGAARLWAGGTQYSRAGKAISIVEC
ncbi:MAG: Sir2 family NAD-dependent protein deacetylase [Pirellulales bacterium]